MSTENNFIKNLLDIKDENIRIDENSYIEKSIKYVKSKLMKGILTYNPDCCEVCGVVNEFYTVIKHGFKTSRITLTLINGTPVYLDLKKQRFKCKECQSTFIAKTDLVDESCHISNNKFVHTLNQEIELPKLIKTVIETTKLHIDKIQNTMNYQYTNGPIEGIIGKIKLIKKVAYGYRNFYSLKTRVNLSMLGSQLKEQYTA